MTDLLKKPTTGFWVISSVALIWNLMGVMAYLNQAYMGDEIIAALPEAERSLYEVIPAWYTAAFAIAVFAGVLGCILLLARKKIALQVFILSLVGILVQMFYNFFISNSMDVYGPGSMVMPIMVIIIGIYLVWFSKNARNKNWLT